MTEDQQQGDRDRLSPCAWCGEPFRPPKPTGRRPKYCKAACRQAAYEDRLIEDEVKVALAYGERRPKPRRGRTAAVTAQAEPEPTLF
ncbi:hypothetical protein F7Q99_39425 [Streptomyces kaniharaensis]|uniref:Uncharacterized protein n=1 Tax=Streptomyces kaniharaensis TaxID=212423 RepID=A0A6N7L557_9ACTN|nr:hypothetical protein [Streptomyces kaniharaensis]MQS18089.1 hypothetical protein [Streptomyces kaniharaensis]MQS18102.1 hypothetical protein [Streptomyces kaniharaensis]